MLKRYSGCLLPQRRIVLYALVTVCKTCSSLSSFKIVDIIYIFFCFYRRSCSLDIEVSASGFTKDLERDGALLHPAGPEGEEEDDEDKEEDQAEHSGEEEQKEEEESLDREEYKHAILELEGLKVSDSRTDTQDEDKEIEAEEDDEEPGTTQITGSVEETEKDHNKELNEAEDECPELLDLSASNKEFKPFRYKQC